MGLARPLTDRHGRLQLGNAVSTSSSCRGAPPPPRPGGAGGARPPGGEACAQACLRACGGRAAGRRAPGHVFGWRGEVAAGGARVQAAGGRRLHRRRRRAQGGCRRGCHREVLLLQEAEHGHHIVQAALRGCGGGGTGRQWVWSRAGCQGVGSPGAGKGGGGSGVWSVAPWRVQALLGSLLHTRRTRQQYCWRGGGQGHPPGPRAPAAHLVPVSVGGQPVAQVARLVAWHEFEQLGADLRGPGRRGAWLTVRAGGQLREQPG